MNALTQAVSQGFSAEQIIDFLIRKSPKYAKDINRALGKGFSASQVLQYLGGKKGDHSLESTLTEHEKTRKTDKERQQNIEKNIGKGALALGAAGLGAYGLSRLGQAGQAITPEVLPALQKSMTPREGAEINITPRLGFDQKQIEFQPPNQLMHQAKQLPAPQMPGANMPQPQPPINPPPQPTQPNIPKLNYGDILNQVGLKEKVDDMRRINPPEVISRFLRYQFPKNKIKEIESHLNMPIENIVSGYIESTPKIDENQPQNIQQPQQVNQTQQQNQPIQTQPEQNIIQPEPSSQELEIPKEKTNAKEIGSSVLLPDGGIGEIQSVNQGIAKVNVDGKDRHKKLDELIEMPLPAKDLADLFDDLIGGIEKKTDQEVSKNVYWAGYDPKTNELAYIPHLGALYVYKDIAPEDAEKLTSLLTERKTTGENFIGVWEKGTKSPIGAAMSSLIQRLQKQAGGKGKEYSGKYEKIYDALEPAKLEAKKKYDLEKKASKPVKEKPEKKDEKRKTKKPRPD